MTTQQILNIEFEKLRVELIAAYDKKGMRASGKFAEGLEVETDNNTAILTGDQHAEQLQYGRKKGKFPPIEAIKQWIHDKGIVNKIKGDISVSSLAFLIARKISKQGWKRQGYGGVNLIDEVITIKRIQNIIDKVGNELTLTIVNRLEKEIIKLSI